ncbi:hypothetical protein Agub_g15010 [Astrephomene gubernaculifera]|uniref:Uncharacterized protein n=1 Tax=Astrephomene gubernaculifera TaxID=47775 RepID=A0AAD3E2C5_9CHLO|nr:hypothetical protein Agub_g15010 [Astrephomene gubernaculifera]
MAEPLVSGARPAGPEIKRKRVKDKGDDLGILAVRADLGYSGPVNWPNFDPDAPIYGARSRAAGSVSRAHGHLVAGPAAMLPTFTPRNHYLSTPHEQDVIVNREQFLTDQCNWLQSTQPGTYVPRDVLLRLLSQDIRANTERDPAFGSSKFSWSDLNAAYASGYPSYEAAAAELAGNRTAALTLPGGMTVVFSATGQIGEVLSLTLLRAAPTGGSETHMPPAPAPACGGAPAPAPASGTAAAAAAPPRLQAYPAAQLSLNKSIWQIELKEHRAPAPLRPTAGVGTAAAAGAWAGAPTGTAAAGAGGKAHAHPSHDGAAAAAAAAAAGREEGEERCLAPPAVWVAVRCNYCVNVLLAHQVDPQDWRSWRLEWRASHLTPRLTAHICWNPHLPELALVTADGAVAIASTHAAAGGDAASLRQLDVRQVLRPMHPQHKPVEGEKMRKRKGPYTYWRMQGDQPMALVLGSGRLRVAYGGCTTVGACVCVVE